MFVGENKRVSLRDIAKIYKIYNKVFKRLPKTYPKAGLVVHTNLEELQKYYIDSEGKAYGDESLPFAFCDANTNTIHVHLTISDEPIASIAWYYLHEIGHLYAYQRYGIEDRKWQDYTTAEKYANEFAGRWVRKMKKEGRLKV